jgi:hypothetical protein
MQRVRIGLTGLALVFLLVLLGAVIRSFSNDEQATMNMADRSIAAGAASNGQEPSEPLAQLGVAPGSPDLQNDSATAKIKK